MGGMVRWKRGKPHQGMKEVVGGQAPHEVEKWEYYFLGPPRCWCFALSSCSR